MSLTPDTEKALMETIKTSMQASQQASKAINNPVTWIMIVLFIGGTVVTMALFIYNSNLETQNDKIDSNKSSMQNLTKMIQEQKTVLSSISHNQGKLATQLENMSERQDHSLQRIANIESSRFRQEDFQYGIQPLKQAVEISKQELDKHSGFLSKMDYLMDNFDDRLVDLERSTFPDRKPRHQPMNHSYEYNGPYKSQ
jgi:hypothetical protein